nr:hypothetical protein [Bacillus subtilis]
MNYEVENMQATVLRQAGSQTIHLSLDVMNIMDNEREQWGITYPFEYENIRFLSNGPGFFHRKCKRLKFNKKVRRTV